MNTQFQHTSKDEISEEAHLFEEQIEKIEEHIADGKYSIDDLHAIEEAFNRDTYLKDPNIDGE